MLKQALIYSDLGWYVFPLYSLNSDGFCTCGDKKCDYIAKHPKTKKGLKNASNDKEKIKDWFKDGDSNIAIVTGEISGITVIDIDVGEGKKGAETWAQIISDYGEPKTLISQTGGGGMHLIFKYNSALKTSSDALGEGIDVRNDGGYIVAAPSIHKTGNIYKWLNWGEKIASLPSFLIRKKDKKRARNNLYKGKYTLTQVKEMLSYISSDSRDLWRSVGIILGREFNQSDDAWAIYNEWSDKCTKPKKNNHDFIMREAFYELSKQKANNRDLSIGTIIKEALSNGWSPKFGEIPIENFLYYAAGNNFIYRPTGVFWIAAAVDAGVSQVNLDGKLIKASDWLKRNRLCTSMTCDPSFDEDYIKGFDSRYGELIEMLGSATYNTYRRATIELGDEKLAQPFVNHIFNIFRKNGDADQFLNYMAHRVQKPEQKPRFALLIAGEQGVGKDTAVELCAKSIGEWNIANIEPSALDSNFNEYCAASLVRISEAANLQDLSKWAFNERVKVLIAGLPDICLINPKYGQKYTVKMHCGVIITTNHLAGGIYIPPDDRRYDVIEAASMVECGFDNDEFRQNYFEDLWDWYYSGGMNHIAAFLWKRDISKFSAANGQRKTEAHKTVVASGFTGDSWLDDILLDLDYPIAVRGDWIRQRAKDKGELDNDIKRKMTPALARAGYAWYRNAGSKDGRWRIGGKNVNVYAKKEIPKDYDPRIELNKEFF